MRNTAALPVEHDGLLRVHKDELNLPRDGPRLEVELRRVVPVPLEVRRQESDPAISEETSLAQTKQMLEKFKPG